MISETHEIEDGSLTRPQAFRFATLLIPCSLQLLCADEAPGSHYLLLDLVKGHLSRFTALIKEVEGGSLSKVLLLCHT